MSEGAVKPAAHLGLIHDGLDYWARRKSEAIAVSIDGQALTYGELARWSDGVAVPSTWSAVIRERFGPRPFVGEEPGLPPSESKQRAGVRMFGFFGADSWTPVDEA